MDYFSGYTVIPFVVLIGVLISYIDARQNNKEKTFIDYLKVGMLSAVIASLVVFVNSGEGREFIMSSVKESVKTASSTVENVGKSMSESVGGASQEIAKNVGVLASVKNAVNSVGQTAVSGVVSGAQQGVSQAGNVSQGVIEKTTDVIRKIAKLPVEDMATGLAHF